MAKKLVVDTGILKLDVNGNGLLRFNPADFNLYQRFGTLARELPDLEKKYREAVEIPGATSSEGEGRSNEETIELVGKELDLAKEIDADIKKKLSWVFGAENDFDMLLGGVNLMSPAGNGERVITNLMNALLPYIENGAKKHAKDAAADAVAQAKKNRAERSQV